MYCRPAYHKSPHQLVNPDSFNNSSSPWQKRPKRTHKLASKAAQRSFLSTIQSSLPQSNAEICQVHPFAKLLKTSCSSPIEKIPPEIKLLLMELVSVPETGYLGDGLPSSSAPMVQLTTTCNPIPFDINSHWTAGEIESNPNYKVLKSRFLYNPRIIENNISWDSLMQSTSTLNDLLHPSLPKCYQGSAPAYPSAETGLLMMVMVKSFFLRLIVAHQNWTTQDLQLRKSGMGTSWTHSARWIWSKMKTLMDFSRVSFTPPVISQKHDWMKPNAGTSLKDSEQQHANLSSPFHP